MDGGGKAEQVQVQGASVEGLNEVTALLVEARTLIAEGEWIRGAMKRIARLNKGRLVFDWDGVDESATVPCYCAVGALREGADHTLNVERRHRMIGRAAEALVRAAVDMGVVRKFTEVWRSDMVNQAIMVNDLYIANKEQALAWFDRAIERAGTVTGG